MDKEAHSADPERKSPINDLKTYWMYFRDFAKPNLEDAYKYDLKTPIQVLQALYHYQDKKNLGPSMDLDKGFVSCFQDILS